MSNKRLKRPRVNWYKVLMSSNDESCKHHFFELWYLHGCMMSKNRCAYNAIRSHYSTTKIERVRWLGESL